MLCYVDHHDKAYDWAERRKLETHPKTGAAQLVEIRETVKEIVVPMYVQTEIAAPPESRRAEAAVHRACPTTSYSAMACPPSGSPMSRQATEDTLLALADHLPAEAAEALLELATGGKPRVSAARCARRRRTPFEHPDAQRRFRVMANVEELQRALDFPVGQVDGLPASRATGDRSSATTPGRRASPARQEPARPSSRCIGRSIWRARIRTPASC